MAPNQLCQSTLYDVNKIRRSNGYRPLRELPAGVKFDPDECVIQRALRCVAPEVRVLNKHFEAPVGSKAEQVLERAFCMKGRDIEGKPGRVSFPLSSSCRGFVKAFDNGKLPDLDLELQELINEQDELVGV